MSESQLKEEGHKSKGGSGRAAVFEVEPVEVRSCHGEVAYACGSFFYLGSLTDNKGSSSPEKRRTIKKASETFRRLWRVWAMKGLSLKLKVDCTRHLFIPCYCMIARFGTLLRQK